MLRWASLLLLVVAVGCVEVNVTPPTTSERSLMVFSATWCQPCLRDKPAIERVKAAGYRVDEYDYDHDRDMCQAYGVTSVPTYFVFEPGVSALPIYRGGSIAEAMRALEGNTGPPDDGRSRFPRL
jgi:thiol-disulfide isomerase/thioredoxin